MKVKDLIRALAAAPEDAEVVFEDNEGLADIDQADILDRWEDDSTHKLDVRLRSFVCPQPAQAGD